MNCTAAPFAAYAATPAAAAADCDALEGLSAYDVLARRVCALREALDVAEGAAAMLAWAVMGCYVHDCSHLAETQQDWRPQLPDAITADLNGIQAQLAGLSDTVRGVRDCPGADMREGRITLADAAPPELEAALRPESTSSAADGGSQRSMLRSAETSLALSRHMSSGRFDVGQLSVRAGRVPQPAPLERAGASGGGARASGTPAAAGAGGACATSSSAGRREGSTLRRGHRGGQSEARKGASDPPTALKCQGEGRRCSRVTHHRAATCVSWVGACSSLPCATSCNRVPGYADPFGYARGDTQRIRAHRRSSSSSVQLPRAATQQPYVDVLAPGSPTLKIVPDPSERSESAGTPYGSARSDACRRSGSRSLDGGVSADGGAMSELR